jgi:hypothetical protein
MTDSKRRPTLPGLAARERVESNDAPDDSLATTTVMGSPLPDVEAPLEDEPEEKRGFDPFKFQRITVPPGLRADIIRWRREAQKEALPEDTVPPMRRASPPDSITPVGSSSAPKLSLSSARGVVIALGLLLLPLAVVGLANTLRSRASSPTAGSQPATGTFEQGVTVAPERATSRAPAPTTTRATATTGASAASARLVPSSAAPPRAAPARVEPSRETRSPTKSHVPKQPVPQPSRPTNTPSGESSAGAALDRPFSLPK